MIWGWTPLQVRMKDLRTSDESAKEVDLPVESLVAALAELGISPA